MPWGFYGGPDVRIVNATLDNVVWQALAGPHRHWARGTDSLRWYPGDVAPFVAVPSAAVLPDLSHAVSNGLAQPAYFIDVLPDRLPVGWDMTSRAAILQMVPAADEPAPSDESDIVGLGESNRGGMVELARIAFPDFFRPRTALLGDYVGIFAGTRLVAMAGERLAVEGHREISGVCTHPEFAGRGFARRLTLALLRRHRSRGIASFLHVSDGNLPARRLYESMSFVTRASLPFGKVERRPARA